VDKLCLPVNETAPNEVNLAMKLIEGITDTHQL
jgi:hypothetical protein